MSSGKKPKESEKARGMALARCWASWFRRRIWAVLPVIATIVTLLTFGKDIWDWFDEIESDDIVVGFSLKEIRNRNQVRQMSVTEQGLELTDLSGIYGFVDPLQAKRLFSPSWLFPSHANPRPYRHKNTSGNGVEIHRTADGKVMAIVYLTEDDASELSGLHRGAVEVFAFFEQTDDHPVLVGLPLSRVEDWKYQYLYFAPVLIRKSAAGAGVKKREWVRASEPADGAVRAERKRVVLGENVDDLRASNDVRALRYEEQSVDLSRLSGVWGVTQSSFFEDNMRRGKVLLHNITLQSEPERYGAVVEVHKAVDGKVSVVGFVEEGTVSRLLDAINTVGNVYFYHKSVRKGLVPVAIPASRIVGWDYRAPHEFSEIVID